MGAWWLCNAMLCQAACADGALALTAAAAQRALEVAAAAAQRVLERLRRRSAPPFPTFCVPHPFSYPFRATVVASKCASDRSRRQ